MSNADDELDEKAREWQEKRKKAKGKREIEISVNTEGVEQLIGKIKDLEPQAEAFKSLAENLARKCQAIGVNIDSSEIKDVDDFKTVVQEYYEKKEENEGIPLRVEKEGGSGQVPLSMQSRSGSREFETQEEMFDALREQARSRDDEERKNAEKILDELFRKGLKGMREVKGYRTSYEGKESERDKLNEIFRKSRKKKEDESE